MDSSQFGYQGLSEPYDTIYSDTRPITIYPNGKIEDSSTGEANKMNKDDLQTIGTVIGIAGAIIGVLFLLKRKGE